MHRPVLLHEVVEGLNHLRDDSANKVFVDATYGAGGHTKEVLRNFPDVKVITIDQDPDTHANITGNFRNIDQLLGDIQPDAILLDLGFSSDQMDHSGRGFSFQRDEPLDMRLSQAGPSAADILNSWDEHAIELILRGFGEEKYSRKIAREIIERRKFHPFTRTLDLVDVVDASKSKSYRDKIHPATKTFQALRIAVNEELSSLEEGLSKSWKILSKGGRLAVISFHSLEDRIVKNFFRNLAQEGSAKLISKKPIVPSSEEIKENPRSRSAKLRIIVKL